MAAEASAATHLKLVVDRVLGVCLQQSKQLSVLDARHLEYLSRPVADVARLKAGVCGRGSGGMAEGR
jgi:hypothetical protein